MKEALLKIFPWVFPFLLILCSRNYVESSLTTTFGFPFKLLFELIGLQKDFSFKWLYFLQYWHSSFCLLSLMVDLFVLFLFPFIIGYNIHNDLIIVYIIMEFSSQIFFQMLNQCISLHDNNSHKYIESPTLNKVVNKQSFVWSMLEKIC